MWSKECNQNILEREGGRKKAWIFWVKSKSQLPRGGGWSAGGGAGAGPGSPYLVGFILQLLFQVLFHLELVLQLPDRVIFIVLILWPHIGVPIF